MHPDIVLDFWFDRPASQPLQPRKEWWQKDESFDADIRIRFGAAVETALAGGYADWEDAAESALALLILLDQFPRNIFRGQARAFAGDARARSVAHKAVDRGFDITVPTVMRQFFYMPFQHSENLAEQDLSILLFTALEKELPGHDLLHYAERHRAIIAQFDRFPHRNAALGRTSTPEEIAFLKQPGSSF
ncbi:MAG TPA: DUF924 family protein [Ferrovibrio sp.]|uniref:DUF924 family protein n=1 Tax=Ferrovibrio sp. TaxID=1917215 RepID=UPI002ED467E9